MGGFWRRGAGAIRLGKGGGGLVWEVGYSGLNNAVLGEGGAYIDVREHGWSFCSLFRFTLYCLAYASPYGKTSMLFIGSFADSHTVPHGGHLRQRFRGYGLGMRNAVAVLLAEMQHPTILATNESISNPLSRIDSL